jgi:hypothetical protein
MRSVQIVLFASRGLITAENGPPVVVGEVVLERVVRVLTETVDILVIAKIKHELNELIAVNERVLCIFCIEP